MRSAGTKLLAFILVASVFAGLAVDIAGARARNGSATISRVGPLPRRLLRVLNRNGFFEFQLAGGRTTPTVTKEAAINDALRGGQWHPVSAIGISLVRLTHRAGKVPAGYLAWLVSVQPRKRVGKGPYSPAANYVVVVISARDGHLLGIPLVTAPCSASSPAGAGRRENGRARHPDIGPRDAGRCCIERQACCSRLYVVALSQMA